MSIALTERHRHRFCTTVARPPRRSSTSGEALDRTLVSSSSFPCSHGELSWTGAPVGRAPMSSSGRRRRPVHGGPEPRWSTARGPSPRDYQFKNKSEIQLFQHFALSPLIFSNINPQSMNLQSNLGISKIIPKRSIASEKSTKIAPKLRKFISLQPQLQNSQNHFLFRSVHSYSTCWLHFID
jgi:hypothetical protein